MASRIDYYPNLSLAINSAKEDLEEFDPNRGNKPQVLSFGSRDWMHYGRLLYARNDDLDVVRDQFKIAINHFREFLKLRHEVYIWSATRVKYVDNQAVPVEPEVKRVKDYSLSNSYKNLRFVYTALAIGESELACELASQIWDPEDAIYIGKQSPVCTLLQQAVAYAVRDYMGNQSATAADWLKKHKLPLQETLIGYEYAMVNSLIERHESLVQDILNYLRLHEKVAKQEVGSEWFICFHALAIAKLGADADILSFSELPQDNVYLPLELIASV